MKKNNFDFLKKIVVNFLNQLSFQDVSSMNIKIKLQAQTDKMDFLHVVINESHAIDIQVTFEKHEKATNYKTSKKISNFNMRLNNEFIQSYSFIHDGITKEYISSIFVQNVNWINIGLRLDYKIVYCLKAKHKHWRDDMQHVIYCFMDKDNRPLDVYGVNDKKEQERLPFCLNKVDKLAIMYLFYKNCEEDYNNTFPPFSETLNITEIDELDNKLTLVSMLQF